MALLWAFSSALQKYLGEIEMWNRAEESLRTVLDKFGHPWKLNPGDGAFYGPKVRMRRYSSHSSYHVLNQTFFTSG